MKVENRSFLGQNLKVELLSYLTKLFAISELNRLPQKYGGGRIFSDPLVGVAQGNDPMFRKFKEVVASEHLTPIEMWLANNQENVPDAELRILSIVFPFVTKIREARKNQIVLPRIILPAEIYSVGRNYANKFIPYVMRKLIGFFEYRGYKAVSGMISESFTILTSGGFHSTWSERHIAFAAGLGTFSLQEALITEVGCNVRLGSVITDSPLNITERKNDEPYGNCLFYAKGTCRKCEENCPADAITEEGHNKTKCYNYGQKLARKMISRLGSLLKPHNRRVNGVLRPPVYPVGCAFCQFGVPCMDKNPVIEE